MSSEGPPRGANPAPAGGSEAAKPRAWRGHSIVVIGGGWAGCAAAVELARQGHRVELHEAAPSLGGRARTVVRDGLPLDNGEHLLLGAYVDTLSLAATLRDDRSRSAWRIGPLAIAPLAQGQRNALSLAAAGLPAPLGLLMGLVRATGLTWRERVATIRWFAGQQRAGFVCDPGATVATLLAALPARVRENLWAPLCVAALNTPPSRASGQVFLNVLRESLGAGARASAVVVPRDGLADAVPDRAAQWLAARGHAVRTATRTRITAIETDHVLLESAGRVAGADAAVVAVGPHQLASAFSAALVERHPAIATAAAEVAQFAYEPITTVYLGYAAPLALRKGLLRLDEAPGQWLFDRRDILRRATPSPTRPPMEALLSVVISAHGPHEALDNRALVAAIDAQLRRLRPDVPALCWSQVIEEKRATYACTPLLARPACGPLAARVYLAGDYTYPAFPATLEAAVRSGLAAAQAVVRAARA